MTASMEIAGGLSRIAPWRSGARGRSISRGRRLGAVVGDRGGERLAGQVRLVGASRVQELRHRPPASSSIRSVTSRPDSRRAFCTAWTISRASPSRRSSSSSSSGQRHRATRLRLHLVAVERLHDQRHVVGLELVLLPVHIDPHLGPAGDRLGDRGRVERLDRGGHLGIRLAEAGAERSVVRLHLVAHQLGLLGDELELLDVQLSGRPASPEPLDRLPLGAAGDDHRLAQRLADLDPGLGARRPAQLDRAAHRLHAGLELAILERGVGLGEVEQVNGVRVGRRIPPPRPPARFA